MAISLRKAALYGGQKSQIFNSLSHKLPPVSFAEPAFKFRLVKMLVEEFYMSDWLDFHICALNGTCKILDISQQSLIIDAGILIVLFGIGTGIKRLIKGEKVLSRKNKRSNSFSP